ncbi:uncharacterized protein zgc:174935 [Brienomyrus brachyistius]|uniref:uncharacterized protein zgc:174935 n=1 Tax=Brienomyrus brachyistius TaxID=42636 RepID=UPI0020B3F977|nr:uncharacterized protein zgc:174935 [Brienomyrus brachyistius]
MKSIIVLMSIAVVGVMASLAFIYIKHNEKVKLSETFSKLDTKHQTVIFEINEHMADIAVMQDEMETAIKQENSLRTELEKIGISNKRKKDQLETCRVEEKQRSDEMAALENQRKTAEEQFKKEKAAWTSNIAALEKQLTEKSTVCMFVNMTKQEAKELCGNVQPVPVPK